MILNELMEKKDLRAYIYNRIEHLTLEKEKMSLVLEEGKREKAIVKISAKITELRNMKRKVDVIKESSKYESGKVVHLKKMKIAHLKGELPNGKKD